MNTGPHSGLSTRFRTYDLEAFGAGMQLSVPHGLNRTAYFISFGNVETRHGLELIGRRTAAAHLLYNRAQSRKKVA